MTTLVERARAYLEARYPLNSVDGWTEKGAQNWLDANNLEAAGIAAAHQLDVPNSVIGDDILKVVAKQRAAVLTTLAYLSGRLAPQAKAADVVLALAESFGITAEEYRSTEPKPEGEPQTDTERVARRVRLALGFRTPLTSTQRAIVEHLASDGLIRYAAATDKALD